MRLIHLFLGRELRAKDSMNRGEQFAGAFRAAFERALLDKLPSWEAFITESARTDKPIEVHPPNWNGLPLTIEFRFDTVTVFPLSRFGLDYCSTATDEDLEQRPHLVFARVVSEIADFVSGRTVVAIKRGGWPFRGADVRFVPTPDRGDALRAGASIVAWPPTG